MSDETVVENQGTPAHEVGQVDQAPIETGVTGAGVESKSTAADVQQAAQPEFDVQKSYSELQDRYSGLDKSYREIRGAFTRSSQEAAELRKQLEGISKTLAKVTETPINPEQFFKDLQTHGPKALDAYMDQRLNSVQEQYQQQLLEQAQKAATVEIQFEVYKRERDTENYPDFTALKPVMTDILNSPNCPIDRNAPVAEQLEAAYKLARDNKSADAIKQAAQFGQQRAEAQLAKEAKTAVAGGGKAGVPTDPRQIKDVKELRKWAVQQFGEVEL